MHQLVKRYFGSTVYVMIGDQQYSGYLKAFVADDDNQVDQDDPLVVIAEDAEDDAGFMAVRLSAITGIGSIYLFKRG